MYSIFISLYIYMDYFKLFMTFRIILAIVVLHYLPIPTTFKLLLIVFFDNIDGRFVKNLKIHNFDHTITKEYQLHDKMADLISYILILHYLYKHKILDNDKLIDLAILLGYRLIGDLIFFIQKNRKVLFYFPNIFEMLALFWVILQDTNNTAIKNSYHMLLIIAITLIKTYHEYFLHNSDDNHKTFNPIFSQFLSGKLSLINLLKNFKKEYIY